MRTSVLLKYRPSRAVGREGSLYFQFIRRGRVKTVTTSVGVYPHEWNARKGCIQIPTDDGARARRLEKCTIQLRAERERLRRAAYDMENRQGDFPLEELVALYHRKNGDRRTLGGFVEGLIPALAAAGQERTARGYRSVVNKIALFNGGRDMALASFTPGWIVKFEAWMLAGGVCRNTSSYYLRGLRAILNRAVREQAVVSLPENLFADVYTGIARTRKRALRREVIDELAKMDFTDNRPEEPDAAGLAFSRDLFLLSFYMMGIPFVDLCFLKKEYMKEGVITYRRRKTGQAIEVPVTAEAKAIIGRYADDTAGSEYLLPLISDPEKPARQQYESALRLHNLRLRRIAARLGVDGGFSSYAARHTWATAARDSGVEVGIISMLLGHTSERTTRIYLDSIDCSLAQHIAEKVIASVRRAC